MALPSIGGGSQIGDGNLNEIQMDVMSPQTATVTANLTVAQITNDLLVGNPSTSAASYTLPTVAALEAVVTNAKIGSWLDLVIVNLGTSSGVITVLTNTGWTLTGLMTLAVSTSSQFRAYKSGAGAWTLYRIS